MARRLFLLEAAEESPEVKTLAAALYRGLVEVQQQAERNMPEGLSQVTLAGYDFIVAAKRKYVDEIFLLINCGGDAALLNRVLMCSAKTRILEAAQSLSSRLSDPLSVSLAQSVTANSPQEEFEIAFRAILEREGEPTDAWTLVGFSSSGKTFGKYPYNLIPDSAEVRAITANLQDFGHDFEAVGLGMYLLYPHYVGNAIARMGKNKTRGNFFRENLDRLRKASLYVLRNLINSIKQNPNKTTVDINELMRTVEAALNYRIHHNQIKPSGVKINMNLPNAPLFIENACEEELFILLYALGKNSALLLEQQAGREIAHGEINFVAREVEYEGSRYLAIQTEDTAQGLDPRKIAIAKRLQLQQAAGEGDASAATELAGFDKWRFRSMTIAEIYNLIFDRCVSGKAVAEKKATHTSGLGLDMARNILEKHGARVFVADSTVEKDDGGAVFLILIPMDSRSKPFAEPLAPADPEVPRLVERALAA